MTTSSPHTNGSVVLARWRQCAPIQYMLPWTHSSPQPKQHLDRFSGCPAVHDRDRQTDGQTTLLRL